MLKKSALFVMLSALAAAAYGKTLVADPGRAAHTACEPLQFMDRDFWYMLRPMWHSMPGVKDEAFVKNAGGWHVKWQFNTRNNNPLRVLWLRDLKIYQRINSRPRAVSFASSVIPAEKDSEVYNPSHVSDGNAETVCAVSGNIGDLHTRYTPVKAIVRCQFKTAAPLSRLTLAYGVKKQPDIGKVSFFVDGKEIIPAKVSKANGTLNAIFSNTPAVKTLDILCESDTLRMEAAGFSEYELERLKKYPFSSHMMRPVPFGLSQDNFDRKSMEKQLEEYKKTHIGISFSEWDSQAFLQSILPANRLYKETTSAFGTIKDNRQDMAKMMERFWKWHSSIFFDRIWGMSGATAFAHYGMEWGGNVSGLELTNHTSSIAHRTLMRYTAGAGRQYGKPWLLYLAYYLGKYTPNSKSPPPPKNASGWFSGPDAGISPSFARRLFLSGYFMGNTFLSFEAQPWGQAEQVGKNQFRLNANGKVLKEFYEWSRSPAGKRGSWYTPILLLIDYHHGHVRRTGTIWSWSQKNIPMTKGDWMSENFSRAIDYYDGLAAAWDKPPYSHNLHNSTLGDVFDTAIGNPPSGKYPAFDNYPVVVLTDEIDINTKLQDKLENYVINGGTLVVNVIHLNSLPAGMRKLKLTGKKFSEEGLTIAQARGGKVVLRSKKRTPLAVKYKYGFGNVLVTLPEYFLGKNVEQPSPYLVRFLENIQKEVLPFKISGDAQFVISNLGSGKWKLALINNKGVLKLPWERVEKFDKKYTTRVKITLPPGATMKEIYYNEKISGNTITLPPGGVRVLEIDNIVIPKKDDLKLLGTWELDGTPAKLNVGKAKEWQADVKYSKTASGKTVYDASMPKTIISVNYSTGFPLKAATFEFWAKPDLNYNFSDRGGYPLAGRYFWASVNNKRWNFIVLDQFTMHGPPAKHGRWDHLAFSWDEQNCRFYVNGKEYNTNGVPIKVMYPLWAGQFDIATRGRGRRTFGGEISSVKLYGKALSPAEIKKLYENSKKTYQE